MTDHFDDNFYKLAKQHAMAASKHELMRKQADTNKEITEDPSVIMAEEAMLRTLVFNYKPKSSQEAQTKLLYVIVFLSSTRNSLSQDELSTIMGSIEHVLKSINV